MTFVEFVMLLFGGMSVFEALTTAFGTAGTGGFGVLNDSMASYSPYIQIVVTVFMILFSVNFSCYYLLLIGRFRDVFNAELRTFILIVAASIGIITVNIHHLYASIGESLRHSAFAVGSIISTTGFATEDFNAWPELSRAILVLLMFIGACAGSTGGGIKVSRIVILIKSIGREIGSMIWPHRVKKVMMDKRPLDGDITRSVNVYMVSFVLVFAVSFLLLCIEGHDLVTNFTAVTATINNIGPGLEMVGPTQNFSFFSYPSKLILIFDMLAGRLELFPMLVLFTPGTWKK